MASLHCYSRSKSALSHMAKTLPETLRYGSMSGTCTVPDKLQYICDMNIVCSSISEA